jgi:hypothetical protein
LQRETHYVTMDVGTYQECQSPNKYQMKSEL